jgi:pimeloyl-ACP methyl ester carboxylesterase
MSAWARIRWSRIITFVCAVVAAAAIWFYFREQPYSVPYLLLIAAVECVLIVFLIFLFTAPLSPQRKNLVFVLKPTSAATAIRKPGKSKGSAEDSLDVPESSFDHRRPHYDVEMYARGPALLLQEYAALASAAYNSPDQATGIPEKWSNVPFALPDKWRSSGLHCQIWEHREKEIVAIAFRGTRFFSLQDWIANLHWFIWLANEPFSEPRFHTHYTIINEEDFKAAVKSVLSDPARADYQLVTVGHSLGGGLAQFFAFKSPNPVSHAFAFNSSPVNGHFIAADKDKPPATTFVSAFQHGEILAYLRFALSKVVPRSALDYWEMRFNLLQGFKPITHHAMRDFAVELRTLSQLPEKEARVKRLDRIEQFKLIYDYIKFHIALYLATPPVVALFAQDRHSHNAFIAGMVMMVALYIIAGIHAAWFMGTHVNMRWSGDFLDEFERAAFSPKRRFMHHWIYWAGLIAGLSGVVVARITVQ